MRNDGQLVATSVRKTGRRRLRQVTLWDKSGGHIVDYFVRKNPGILYRRKVLEKIDLSGRLKTTDMECNVFQGIGLTTYPLTEILISRIN